MLFSITIHVIPVALCKNYRFFSSRFDICPEYESYTGTEQWIFDDTGVPKLEFWK